MTYTSPALLCSEIGDPLPGNITEGFKETILYLNGDDPLKPFFDIKRAFLK